MSSNFIQSVDERTRLAGANRLEILLFISIVRIPTP